MNEKAHQKAPNSAKVTFFCAGIAALIAWNAILTGLDFFNSKFTNYDVSFYFSIPLFIGLTFISFFISPISKVLSLRNRIIWGQMLILLFMILTPIIAVIIPSNTGFWIDMAIILLLGFSNSLFQSSFIAYASSFPNVCVSLYWTGTAIAGVGVNILRMIFLGIFGDRDEGVVYGTICYFAVAGVYLFFSLFLFLWFMKSPYSTAVLRQAQGEGYEELGVNPISERDESTREENSNVKVELLNEKEDAAELKEKKTDKRDLKYLWRIFKLIMPMPILIWLIYIQTFMMFPGVALKKEISGLSKAWSGTLLVFVYNIFDTVGKYCGEYRRFYNVPSTVILVLGRFIFYMSFLVMASEDDALVISADWFAFVNIAAFAFLNGYATSCIMILTPEQTEVADKETAGFLISFPYVLGFITGAFLALPFVNFGRKV